eukprot:jgi/Chrzof1/12790/Cz07g07200.t1
MFPFPREFFGPISGMFQDAAGQQSYRRGGDMRQGRRRQRVPGDRRMAQFKEPFDSEEDFMATDSDEEAAMQFMHDVMMQDQQSRQQDRRQPPGRGQYPAGPMDEDMDMTQQPPPQQQQHQPPRQQHQPPRQQPQPPRQQHQYQPQAMAPDRRTTEDAQQRPTQQPPPQHVPRRQPPPPPHHTAPDEQHGARRIPVMTTRMTPAAATAAAATAAQAPPPRGAGPPTTGGPGRTMQAVAPEAGSQAVATANRQDVPVTHPKQLQQQQQMSGQGQPPGTQGRQMVAAQQLPSPGHVVPISTPQTATTAAMAAAPPPAAAAAQQPPPRGPSAEAAQTATASNAPATAGPTADATTGGQDRTAEATAAPTPAGPPEHRSPLEAEPFCRVKPQPPPPEPQPEEQLAKAEAKLREAQTKFQQYLQDTQAAATAGDPKARAAAGGLTHKQVLELNEMAMRVLLTLDEVNVKTPEQRQKRKDLIKQALKLLDEIQGHYKESVSRSMQLDDDVVTQAQAMSL